MIHIDRLSKPEILVRKEKEWIDNFIASNKKRPDNSKYGHKQIRNSLNSMSFHKCFYCERKLTGIPNEIDHYIEVADPSGKNLAFKWENLFLACDNCNNKLKNTDIPVSSALNPCINSDTEIQENITFKDELITAKNNTELGLQTIKKFRLDTELLDMIRSKQLNLFNKVLVQIQKNQIKDSRKEMNKIEKESLLSFAQKDHQFSLMFRIILSEHEI